VLDLPPPQPWYASYGTRPFELKLPAADMLTAARSSMADAAQRPFLLHFDESITGAQLDEDSDAFAVALAARGFAAGDRLVAQLQNTPEFVIALLGTWKAGGVFVTANPMYREREIALILRDCGAQAFLTLDSLYSVVGPAARATEVPIVLTVAKRGANESVSGVQDFATIVEANRGRPAPPSRALTADDVAALVYTSGTTGPPKGAMITHRNLVADASLWPLWLDLTREDVIMGIAPFFHITGLAANVGLALLCGAPLVMAGRFDPGETLRSMERHGATFMVGAVTAYTALLNDPAFRTANLTALRVTASGGAPVASAIAERWQAASGHALQNCYGLTETTALVLLSPPGLPSRADPTSGALSVGIPVSGTVVEIHDDEGRALPAGEIGELVIEGPQVIPGYWRQPAETAHALPDGRLRTGDIGFMDADGWFYIVDRSKDLIVASGYKVWPREVEDILVEHEAVAEAAVVGVPDGYRGETVKAYVSLVPGHTTTAPELIEFCKQRMAAFKYPRVVETLDELPKTASGKILRRELRDRP
jgi:long-chain acyl-CoA synthetase